MANQLTMAEINAILTLHESGLCPIAIALNSALVL